jgi:undecaprenyl-diphosphatase
VSSAGQAALLGVVQGLTEFLPVSSSAHLILARAVFGFDGDKFGLSFDVACHVGTLVAVLVYFRRDLVRMIGALPALLHPASDEDAQLIWLLAIGTLPAVVCGVLFRRVIEESLRTPAVAVLMLAAGALLLLLAEWAGAKSRAGSALTPADAFWIGCAQALALVPGVSRSGATLTVGLLTGLRRADAARFVFLLAIPAILGAAVSEAGAARRALAVPGVSTLFLIGVITSAVVGYAAVRYLIRYLSSHSLAVFAWYRLVLAGAVTVWFLR